MSKKSYSLTIEKILVVVFLIFLWVFVISVHTYYNNEDYQKDYLLENGFRNPEITGYKWTCAQNTLLKFTFKAVDIKGNNVEGYVCAKRLIMSDNITIEKSIP